MRRRERDHLRELSRKDDTILALAMRVRELHARAEKLEAQLHARTVWITTPRGDDRWDA